MATIHREVAIACDPEKAWNELRDFGAAGRLFTGVLLDCRESGGRRTVTFANGLTVDEQLVTIEDARRRLAYAVLDRFAHHNASMQIVPAGEGLTFVWTSDFLPDEAAARIEPLVDAGCEAIKRSLERLG